MTNHKSVGRYISILFRQGQNYITNEMKSHDIGRGQFIFLLVLYEHDGISQESLSSNLMIDKATTARAISKLEDAGYVVRKTDTKDRRVKNVYLTTKGRDIKPILTEKLIAWTDILMSDLEEHEKETLIDLLDKMVKSTKNYISEV